MAKKKKQRARKMAMDTNQFKKQQFKVRSIVSLPIALYLGYGLSGINTGHIDLHHIYKSYFWCLMHPKEIWFDKACGFAAFGCIVWAVIVAEAWVKLSYNLMHGKEFGDSKWGNIFSFNEKFASVVALFQQQRLFRVNPKKVPEEVKKLASQNDLVAPKKWGEAKSIKKYHVESDGLNPYDKVLSENVRFRYNSDTLRNNNIFVVGGSGAGKTSFFLTPNLLSLHDCNIYTDPKGSLVEDFGAWLDEQPNTNTYVINMCEMEKSMHFNPFLYLRKKSDVTKLVANLMQNTESEKTKNMSGDPFWPKAERMFLESLFLYVWLECPRSVFDAETGHIGMLERNWKTVLYLLDEAQFGNGKQPPKLDTRMEQLAKKKPDHPAVKAYQRYRSGPDDTVRSVIMTVNARMQPFDNEELLEVFSDNEIPLDQFGVGKNGDGITKSNLFIVIPDDDDTYNFVPGMIYTLLFQELYRQARFFGGKLPLDVGFWLDEFANIKMPSSFDKILATCRSRGIYCVEILQSLAQIKTLFADGAWEGIIGNNDTFIYLGGNEQSTFEYISKLLGKWTIDKRTNGESKGSNGSYSENYDVLGRELMMEYEIRLLPDDECIIFVRGEEPIRDKKWFPWEHKIYDIAKAKGEYRFKRLSKEERLKKEQQEESCELIDDNEFEYMQKQAKVDESIRIYQMSDWDFMMMDLDEVVSRVHSDKPVPHGSKEPEDIKIDASIIQAAITKERKREQDEARGKFIASYDRLTLVDVYSSPVISETRQAVIRELLKRQVSEKEIKYIVHPLLTEEEMMKKKVAWIEMHGEVNEGV